MVLNKWNLELSQPDQSHQISLDMSLKQSPRLGVGKLADLESQLSRSFDFFGKILTRDGIVQLRILVRLLLLPVL